MCVTSDALREIRELLSKGHALTDTDRERLRELFGVLDEWLSSGGFLPGAWER